MMDENISKLLSNHPVSWVDFLPSFNYHLEQHTSRPAVSLLSQQFHSNLLSYCQQRALKQKAKPVLTSWSTASASVY
jgi:hypothetical protein